MMLTAYVAVFTYVSYDPNFGDRFYHPIIYISLGTYIPITFLSEITARPPLASKGSLVSLIAASIAGITIALAVSQSSSNNITDSLATNFFVVLGFDILVYPLVGMIIILCCAMKHIMSRSKFLEIILGHEAIKIYAPQEVFDTKDIKQTEKRKDEAKTENQTEIIVSPHPLISPATNKSLLDDKENLEGKSKLEEIQFNFGPQSKSNADDIHFEFDRPHETEENSKVEKKQSFQPVRRNVFDSQGTERSLDDGKVDDLFEQGGTNVKDKKQPELNTSKADDKSKRYEI